MRYNPELMMVDGGGDMPNNPTLKRQFTPAELQDIIRRLTSGQRLTPEEAAAVGVSAPSSISSNNWNEGKAELDAAAAAARASVDATRAIIAAEAAKAKAAADKAAADKAAADAALASAKTAAEREAARLAQEAARLAAEKAAAEKAAADAAAKAAADKAAKDAATKAAADKAAKDAADKAAADKAASDAAAAAAAGGNASIAALQAQVAALTKQLSQQSADANKYNERMSVYATMADRFNKYGLTGLASKIKELAMKGATEATITLELMETPEYQQRFAANADRLKKGLSVLTPAEYVNVEDSYRQVLRAYGLKQFDNDAYIKQFIANDMSPTEFSNRIVTAVQRVQNADPALVNQLKQYYGIGATDMVAYVLDPEQQFQKIERQIAASEIGVAAARQGLSAGVSVAEQLAAQGVTEAEARKGYATIADILPTAEKLSDIYGTTLDEYRQAEGEQEVFNSLASAQRKRQKLTAREVAAFSGASGTNKTSLTTSAVGQFQNPERTYRPRQSNRPIVGASQFPRTELWPANYNEQKGGLL